MRGEASPKKVLVMWEEMELKGGLGEQKNFQILLQVDAGPTFREKRRGQCGVKMGERYNG